MHKEFFTVLERGWLSCNNIVFVDDDRTVVVDTGYCTHAAQTLLLIEQVLQGRSLDLVLNTHLHSDHCGGNAQLQQRYPELSIWIPPGLSVHVNTWNQDKLSYQITGQLCPRFSFNGLLEPGSHIQLGGRSWEIHAAPGHDPDSIILFEPESRTLISADALWENGFGVVFQELEGVRAFDDVAYSLDLIEKLAPHTVIPGHGRSFTQVQISLQRARSRLNQFVNDPIKHARYAAKVLIKYKLLELQRCLLSDLMSWSEQTPYFAILHRNFFKDWPRDAWLEDLLADLAKSGALLIDGQDLVNTD